MSNAKDEWIVVAYSPDAVNNELCVYDKDYEPNTQDITVAKILRYSDTARWAQSIYEACQEGQPGHKSAHRPNYPEMYVGRPAKSWDEFRPVTRYRVKNGVPNVHTNVNGIRFPVTKP